MFNDRLMLLASGVDWPHIAAPHPTERIEKVLDSSAHLETVVAPQRLCGNCRANARECAVTSCGERLAVVSAGRSNRAHAHPNHFGTVLDSRAGEIAECDATLPGASDLLGFLAPLIALALVFVEQLLAQADRLRRHLDQFVVLNVGKCPFKRHPNRRREPHRLVL
jgi:hypothetical protein